MSDPSTSGAEAPRGHVRPRAPEWLGLAIALGVVAVLCIALSGFLPVSFVNHENSVQELISGFWGHAIAYGLITGWVAALALHFFWYPRYRTGLGLLEAGALTATALIVSIGAAELIDGPMNHLMLDRAVAKGSDYYFRALDQDIEGFNHDMDSLDVGSNLTVMAASHDDLKALAPEFDRLRAVIAKYRRWEHERQKQAI